MKNKDYSWDEFDPQRYLAANYRTILPPDREIFTSLVEFYHEHQPRGHFLEIGCGPNLYPVLAALPYANRLDLIEYGERNVAFLKRQTQSLSAYWNQWIRLLRRLNSVYDVDLQQQLKQKARIAQGSIFDLDAGVYDSASMFFVSESITGDLDEFDRANKKFLRSLKRGGLFFAAFMENSQGYDSPGRSFPAVAVTAKEIMRSFKPIATNLHIHSVMAGHAIIREGHTGMLIAYGNRKR